MLWFIYALISAFSNGLSSLLSRKVLKDYDLISFAFIFNILCAVFMVPLMVSDFDYPTDPYILRVTGVAMILWIVVGITNMKSTQMVEVSVKEPLMQVQILFTMLFAYVFLGEAMTWNKMAGTATIFIGLIVLTYRKDILKDITTPGVRLTILSAFMWSVVGIFDKIAIEHWSTPTYSFMAFLFPGLALAPFVRKRIDKLGYMLKERFWSITIASLLIVSAAYFGFNAYRMTDVSKSVPVLKLSTLVSVFGGIFLLKERDHMSRKALGAVLMILGVALIYVF